MRDIHIHVKRKIILTNETYKIQVDVYHKFKEYYVKVYVLVCIRPE